MAYKKRSTSPELEKAQHRLSGIQQFENKFDFGNGLTEDAYMQSMQKVADLTAQNNDLLTKVDGISTALDQAEHDLGILSSRLLNAIGGKYTHDSIEYEKAGGIRSSEIKHGRKPVSESQGK